MKSNIYQFILVSVFLSLFFFNCSGSDKKGEDPLKNTKKLAIEGHKSLYYQGALPVKGTSIKFIPPFHESTVFVMGKRIGFAGEEFSKSVLKAQESVVIVKDGTKMSWSTAGKLNEKGDAVVQYLNENATKPGLFIMYASVAESYGLVGSSWERGLDTHKAVVANSEAVRKEWDEWADMQLNHKEKPDNSPSATKRFNQYKQEFQKVFESTVYGYVDLDNALKSAYDETYDDFKSGSWKSRFSEIEDLRSSVSEKIFGNWKETIFSFGQDTASELGRAKADIESIADGEGVPLALLKAFSRTTKALFYDGIIKPIGKVTLLSVGYVTWNGIIYPAVVATNSVGTGLYCLVETFALAGKGVVYITAPSVELALGGLLNSTEVVLNESVQSMEKGAKVTSAVARKTSAYSVKTAAVVTETSGKYILAPMSLVGVTSGQTVLGGGLAISGTVTGATFAGTSATAQTVTYASTRVAAGTVGVVGTAASFGTGTTYGVYQLSKAVGVPSGIVIGSGIVLSYEFVSHMSAHSILAVADCTYLVLSLEGGKWVVYGVKDGSKKASRLLTGAVVDMDQIRKEGGTVVKVPLEEGEVEKILGKKKKK
ncbi:hypothetical protein [Leptospira bandrabouensis]|uniref:Uncharacterized protein n=1 Tax=Leptospira bandrabouensis TaxID=2484903 RepID=A0A6H3NUA0_9LEPT|nr:hypothetical protein [Leptospira bandrabouensis]MCG6153976.1 hypothetical protein [Leptospira bandrabouensis]MCW7459830.1 hypothetical protein [Leptospira bandrabouensis]MCW7479259.1 hypothetical protein [Leptospira bandrabouensis]MCW7486946.1 hypothetical protein [Leptospira bandrabouensis]TGN06701.1 hypothetical protein EHR07_07025 [Leptospira bandrabouensis]